MRRAFCANLRALSVALRSTRGRLFFSAVLFALLLPIGEGLALGGMVLFSVATLQAAAGDMGGRQMCVYLWRLCDHGFMAAMLLFLLLGLGVSIFGPYSVGRASELARWAPLLLVVFIPLGLAQFNPTERRQMLRYAGTAFVLMLVLSSIFGLYQYWSNTRPFEGLSRVDSGIASQGRVPGNYGHTAAGGFFFHRLKMAHVLVVGLAVLLPRQLFRGLSWRRRAIEALLGGVLLSTLLLTFTRAALMGVLLAFVGIFSLALLRLWQEAAEKRRATAVGTAAVQTETGAGKHRRTVSRTGTEVQAQVYTEGDRGREITSGFGRVSSLRVIVLWSLGLGAVVVALYVFIDFSAVVLRLESILERQASDVRGLIWSQAIRIIGDHPFGIGLGNYPRIVERYYDTAEPAFNIRTYPHNIILAAWAEAGPLGALAYIWGMLSALLACFKALFVQSSGSVGVAPQRSPVSGCSGPGVRRARRQDVLKNHSCSYGEKEQCHHVDSEQAHLLYGFRVRILGASGLFLLIAFIFIGFTHDVLYHNNVSLCFYALLGVVLAEVPLIPSAYHVAAVSLNAVTNDTIEISEHH